MMYETPTLETERLILKRGTVEDFVKVYEYNFVKLRDIGGEFVYEKQNPKKIESFVDYADTEERVLDFIMYLKTGEPIGNLILDRYNEELNSLEISINIHPNYWGYGYAKESILEVMKYVFDNLGIDNIIYGYALDNVKSKKVSDKIGFERLKIYTEHYSRINKDIVHEEAIMSKEKYYELYEEKKNNLMW